MARIRSVYFYKNALYLYQLMLHLWQQRRLVLVTLSEALAIRVDELMKEKKLTQYRLAQLSGIAETTIADIRKMRNKGTNIQNINSIAQGMGIDLIQFFNSPLFKGENITD